MPYPKLAVAVTLIVACATAAAAQKALPNKDLVDVVVSSTGPGVLEELIPEAAKYGVEGSSFAVGRVTDRLGRNIRGAAITLYSIETNEIRRVSTNVFGYYRFADLEPGSYLIAIQHRSYLFVTGSMSFTIDDRPVEINFLAERPR